MTQPLFVYNQEQAVSAGQSGYITESGDYILTIDEAKLYTTESNAKFIEFSGETDDGRKVNYLSVCVFKKDGSPNTFGQNMVQAIMGCAGVQQITEKMLAVNHVIAPEFTGKRVGLVLQKILKTKKSTGADTFSFDIRIPFIPNTRQTIAEKIDGAAPAAIDKIVSQLSDKDERSKAAQSSNQWQGNNSNEYPGDESFF